MRYVYILQSLVDGTRFYTGLTDNLKVRVSKHNSGVVSHTAKHRPWHLKTYVAFSDHDRAAAFEKYLKSGSGRALAKARL